MLGKRCLAGLDLFVCGSGSSSSPSLKTASNPGGTCMPPPAPVGYVPHRKPVVTAPAVLAVPKGGNGCIREAQRLPIEPGGTQCPRAPVGYVPRDSKAVATAPCVFAVPKGGNVIVGDGKLCPIEPGDKQSARVPRERPHINLPMHLLVPSTDSRLDDGDSRSDSVASGGGSNGRGKSSSSNVVAFHPDCGSACCGHAAHCKHNNRVKFRLPEVGDGVFFTSPCVHDGTNESEDSEDPDTGMVFLNIQLFLRARGDKARPKKTFVAGAISRNVAARAGTYLAERFYGEFTKYSLRKRKYKGKYLVSTIEFPEDLFDETKTSASQLKEQLGTELCALKRAAEVEFQTKHGTEVSTFLMWASWKLPESLESKGTFDKHLD
jgi:hypothetical protein